LAAFLKGFGFSCLLAFLEPFFVPCSVAFVLGCECAVGASPLVSVLPDSFLPDFSLLKSSLRKVRNFENYRKNLF